MVVKLHKKPQKLRPSTGLVLNAVFSMLGDAVFPHRRGRVLDLFAGTGAFGLRALENGAEWADFVELSGKHCAIIQKNLAKNSEFPTRAKIWRGDVFKIAPRLTAEYDVVFADPPYADDCFEKLANAIVAHDLLAPHGKLVFEFGSHAPAPAPADGLAAVSLKKYGDSAVAIYELNESEVRDG